MSAATTPHFQQPGLRAYMSKCVHAFVLAVLVGVGGCATAPQVSYFTPDAAREFAAKAVGEQIPAGVKLERQYDSVFQHESTDGIAYSCNGSLSSTTLRTIEFDEPRGNSVQGRLWLVSGCGEFVEYASEARFTKDLLYFFHTSKKGSSPEFLLEIQVFAIEAGGRLLRPLHVYKLVDGEPFQIPAFKVGDSMRGSNRVTQATEFVGQPHRPERRKELQAMAVAQSAIAAAGKAQEDARRDRESSEREQERKEHAARVYQGIMSISGGIAEGLRAREDIRQRDAAQLRTARAPNTSASTTASESASVARLHAETLERLKNQRELALAGSATTASSSTPIATNSGTAGSQRVPAAARPLKFTLVVSMTPRSGVRHNPSCYSNVLTIDAPPGYGIGKFHNDAFGPAKQAVERYLPRFVAACNAKAEGPVGPASSAPSYLWNYHDENGHTNSRLGPDDITVTM
jgi:hypothetical protein